jgi:hypothetical protein
MKNIDYNSLLMYVSLILAMAILISIVFGCTYKKQRGYTEFFADSEQSSISSDAVPPQVAGPVIQKRPSSSTQNTLIQARNVVSSASSSKHSRVPAHTHDSSGNVVHTQIDRSSNEGFQSENSSDANLNDVEKKLKQDIKGGTINEKKLTEMVESNQVSSENLKNVIDSFQTELNLK